MKTAWILAGALALGSFAALPRVTFAEDHKDHSRDVRDDVKVESVKFDDLPGQVKETVGRESKDQMLDRIERLTSPKGHVVYRAIISYHGKDDKRVLVVSESGKLLADEDLDEWMSK